MLRDTWNDCRSWLILRPRVIRHPFNFYQPVRYDRSRKRRRLSCKALDRAAVTMESELWECESSEKITVRLCTCSSLRKRARQSPFTYSSPRKPRVNLDGSLDLCYTRITVIEEDYTHARTFLILRRRRKKKKKTCYPLSSSSLHLSFLSPYLFPFLSLSL